MSKEVVGCQPTFTNSRLRSRNRGEKRSRQRKRPSEIGLASFSSVCWFFLSRLSYRRIRFFGAFVVSLTVEAVERLIGKKLAFFITHVSPVATWKRGCFNLENGCAERSQLQRSHTSVTWLLLSAARSLAIKRMNRGRLESTCHAIPFVSRNDAAHACRRRARACSSSCRYHCTS